MDWMYDDGKYGYKKQVFLPENPKEFEKDGKKYCGDPALPIESQKMIQDPNNPDNCIPNPKYTPGFFEGIWDDISTFVVDNAVPVAAVLIILSIFLRYTKTGLSFLKKTFGPSIKWLLSKTATMLKDLLRWLANLARKQGPSRIKGASPSAQRSAFDTLNKELITALNKMKNSKAANPTLRSAAGKRAFNEMMKLLEAPTTYSTNKKIFDATLTQLFQTKKISPQVYKASMNPRTLAKQGPIIDKFVEKNGTETAWREAKALFP